MRGRRISIQYALLTFCVEAVHHTFHDIEAVLDAEVDKVRVEDNVKGRTKLRVVAQKERTRCARSAHASH